MILCQLHMQIGAIELFELLIFRVSAADIELAILCY